MESTVDELGKLRYSLALKISFSEIKPTYDAIFSQLKNARHNGFRKGRHPKGWLEKNFLSAMQKEAIDRVIPGYMENALKEHSLKPVTTPVIKKIDFNRNSPLSATLDFEIAPNLPALDYSRIKLVRKEIKELTETKITEELETLIQRDEVLVLKKGEDVRVEMNDWVKVNYEGFIEGSEFPGSKADEISFKIGGSDLVEFHDHLLGMSSGDDKEIEIVLSERFDENKGKKANFKICLNEISSAKRPELNEKYFKKYGVENLEKLKEKIGKNINSRKESERQTEYRIAVSSQLSDIYEEFDLPEQLVEFENDRIKKEIEQSVNNEKISEKEKKSKLMEGLENVKKDLRIKFILESIFEHEKLIFDENEAAKEFVGLAQMTGQSPDKLIQSPFGRDIYHRLIVRKREELTLDRLIARVFGDPIEQDNEKTNKHVHDENCGHNK